MSAVKFFTAADILDIATGDAALPQDAARLAEWAIRVTHATEQGYLRQYRTDVAEWALTTKGYEFRWPQPEPQGCECEQDWHCGCGRYAGGTWIETRYDGQAD